MMTPTQLEKYVHDVVFHGCPPAFYWRLIRGNPSAWGDAARAPRAELLARLEKHGITIERVVGEVRSRRPGDRYSYQAGKLRLLSEILR